MACGVTKEDRMKRYYIALALVGAAVLLAGGHTALCLVGMCACVAAAGVLTFARL